MTGIEITILCVSIAIVAIAAAIAGVSLFRANRAVLDLRRYLDRLENAPAPDPEDQSKGEAQ